MASSGSSERVQNRSFWTKFVCCRGNRSSDDPDPFFQPIPLQNSGSILAMDSDTKKGNTESDKPGASSISDTRGDRKIDPVLFKEALRQEYTQLAESIDVNLNKILLEENIITVKQFEHLKRTLENKGPIHQSETLLDYLLNQTNEKNTLKFAEKLKQHQPHVYSILDGCVTSPEMLDSFFEDAKADLIKAYEKKEFNVIETLPGEPFFLDLAKHPDCIMPLKFNSQLRKREKLPLMPQPPIYKYGSAAFRSIEEVCESLLKPSGNPDDEPVDILLCTANAGCGKTFLVHCLIHHFMEQSPHPINKCSLIFTIPMREINPVASLTDILADGPKGLNYLSREKMQVLTSYIQMRDCPKNIAIIIDGIDEVSVPSNSDIYGLITKKILPNIKLILLARPEAKLLAELSPYFSNLKLDISGTNKEGIHKYLKGILKQCDQNENQMKQILATCEEKMIQMDLLEVPLYLTLVGIMFLDEYSLTASFTNFQIPETATDIFSSFLTILIRRWVARASDMKTGLKTNRFKKIIYDDSEIPAGIKNSMYILAEMSNFFLAKNIYDFSAEDMKKYCIDETDVKSSGLFCSGDGKYFFRHKLLQEYMSALYFVHPRSSFDVKVKETKQTIDQIFQGYEQVVPFIFGLSKEKGLEIVSKLQRNVQLDVYYLKGVSLNFPAKWMFEAKDPEVTAEIFNLVLSSPLHKAETDTPIPDLPVLTHFFNSLSWDQATSLLLSWYHIQAYKQGETWALKEGDNTQAVMGDRVRFNEDNKQLTITFLDVSLMCLLKKKTFSSVHSLYVDISCKNVPDILTVKSVFPNALKLLVQLGEPLNYDATNVQPYTTTQQPCPSLKHISYRGLTYSPQNQELLLQQCELETLSVHPGPLLHNLRHSTQQPQLHKLHTLVLRAGRLVSDTQTDDNSKVDDKVCDINNLQHLMATLPNLFVFSLTCYSKPASVSLANSLLDNIGVQLPQLTKLHLYNILPSESIQHLGDVLSKMEQLKSLGLEYEEVDRNKEDLIKALKNTTITQLELMHYLGKKTAESAEQSVLSVIGEHHPGLNTKCTGWDETYLQPELPQMKLIIL